LGRTGRFAPCRARATAQAEDNSCGPVTVTGCCPGPWKRFTFKEGRDAHMLIKTILAALACLILVAGCGEAPVEKIAGAQDALAKAKSAEAEAYAADAYKAAADTLRAAMAAKAEADSKFKLMRSYKKTEQLVARAEALANEAAQKAREEKENMRLEIADLMSDTQAVLDSADVAIKKAPQGKGTKAEIELFKTDLAAARTAFTEAQADFGAERFIQAKAKLVAATDKARGVYKEIAAAAEKMKR
jgi:hypothetical protein